MLVYTKYLYIICLQDKMQSKSRQKVQIIQQCIQPNNPAQQNLINMGYNDVESNSKQYNQQLKKIVKIQ